MLFRTSVGLSFLKMLKIGNLNCFYLGAKFHTRVSKWDIVLSLSHPLTVANAPDEMNPEITALSVIYLLIVHNPATGSCPTSGNNFRNAFPEHSKMSSKSSAQSPSRSKCLAGPTSYADFSWKCQNFVLALGLFIKGYALIRLGRFLEIHGPNLENFLKKLKE
jgi:hypothetical protein